MAASNEVAMTIVDPGNRRWAQLVDIEWPVADVVRLLVKRLDLPDSLQYDLIQVDSGRKLPAQQTLVASGISAGDLLQLGPVRNKVLTDLLDALYKEAVDYVAMELWGQAEARLELIKRLDPSYPDPRGVEAALAARTAARAATATQPSRAASTGSSNTGATAGAAATSASAGTSASGGGAASTTTAAQAALSSSRGCLLTALVGIVLLLAAGYWAFRNIRDGLELANLPIIGEYFGDETEFQFTPVDEPELGTGDVQVTLRWDNSADLDLHIVDPAGSEVWYDNSLVDSGGQLDVDANGTCTNDPPVENVFWPSGGAPIGRYDVRVVYFGSCDTTEPANYEVTIRVDGQIVDVQQGTLDQATGSHALGQFER